ncbi:hypothetical protein X777_03571 [Ooceraea biroi]|uniref:Uncharacterized protein n=1 Tax=Ooceraea biroi TaxID=2015173 RepID=A0A026WJ95_OOCBI|nr:hypothetical protein X777_03571 [Ooceraea biroi]
MKYSVAHFALNCNFRRFACSISRIDCGKTNYNEDCEVGRAGKESYNQHYST